MEQDRTYKQSEMSKLFGWSPAWLRRIELLGLLPDLESEPKRGREGRVYSSQDMQRIFWVSSLRHAGVEFAEMKEYIDKANEVLDLLKKYKSDAGEPLQPVFFHQLHYLIPLQPSGRSIAVMMCCSSMTFNSSPGRNLHREEFFHTFNTLHGQNKQGVISSDRPPKAMATLEERLRSRFEWGLAADIQPPDFETRVAILRSRADATGLRIEDEMLVLIARRVQSNIRELEGALTRVTAFASLSGFAVTADLIDIALADLLPQRGRVQPEEVVRKVADVFGVPMERMLGRARAREVAFPRQIAMYLLREEANISLPQIGNAWVAATTPR